MLKKVEENVLIAIRLVYKEFKSPSVWCGKCYESYKNWETMDDSFKTLIKCLSA